MKAMKYAILAGIVAVAFAAGAPANASWQSNGRGDVRGWGSSGWGSSGWGGSGWGSSSDGGSTSGGTSSSGGGTPVPEPSNLLMLGLGLSGLIAGRLAARRRRKN